MLQSLCVEWGSNNIDWHINVHYVKNLCTHMKCVVKHNGDMEWATYGLNGWGIYNLMGELYGSNGWGSYGKVSYCFHGKYAHQGSTCASHCMNTGFGLFELPTLHSSHPVFRHAESAKILSHPQICLYLQLRQEVQSIVAYFTRNIITSSHETICNQSGGGVLRDYSGTPL